MPAWRRCSPSARAASGRRLKPARSGTAASVSSNATGISRATIQRGVRELQAETALPPGRNREPRGGRKRVTTIDATWLRDLDALVEPTAPGDPDSPLRWSCKSTRTLAASLQALGHAVNHAAVSELLHTLGYSLQGNVKTREGRQHPDRNAQFRYIAATVKRALRRRHPAIPVNSNYDPCPIMRIGFGLSSSTP